ncbi:MULTISPECIES: hypothetical protein [Falsihalocynthiibacter]|uniref:hypothetical protein n=1 Tax=Falsihalocynthiibacter TaxID=2854182 RepID=UPI0030021D29
MDYKYIQPHIQKLQSGNRDPHPLARDLAPELPSQLSEYVDILGPFPKQSLEALTDLGLSDAEIARYHMIPRRCVSELRTIWHIHGHA